ncbi:hypothetical protein Tco_0720351 [Tanacetum coccineum]
MIVNKTFGVLDEEKKQVKKEQNCNDELNPNFRVRLILDGLILNHPWKLGYKLHCGVYAYTVNFSKIGQLMNSTNAFWCMVVRQMYWHEDEWKFNVGYEANVLLI